MRHLRKARWVVAALLVALVVACIIDDVNITMKIEVDSADFLRPPVKPLLPRPVQRLAPR